MKLAKISIALIILFFRLDYCSSDVLQVTNLDRYAAMVNSEVILESQIQIERMMTQLYPGVIIEEIGKLTDQEILNRLINRLLLLNEARRFTQVSATEVDEKLNSIKTRVPETRLDSIINFAGINKDELFIRIRNQILIEKYIDYRIRSFIQIQPKEVDKYLNDHATELNLTGIAPDSESYQKIKQLAALDIREKAINKRLEDLLQKLRSEAEIRYFKTETQMKFSGNVRF